MLRTLGERLAAEFPFKNLPFSIKLNLAHLMRAEAEALCANHDGPPPPAVRSATMPKGSVDGYVEKLFEETLRDIYYAEKAILKNLPKMAKKATSEKLAAAFREHIDQTEGQVERLEKGFRDARQVRSRASAARRSMVLRKRRQKSCRKPTTILFAMREFSLRRKLWSIMGSRVTAPHRLG